jgi:hypothetical protein
MDKSRIQSELQNAIDEFALLKHLVDAYKEKHEDLIKGVDTEWLLKISIANTLDSVYSGIERIFELILKETDSYHPTGSSYHKELLNRASAPIKNVRCELISPALKDLCVHLLGFRHLVRKQYLTSVKLLPALENVERTAKALPMLELDLEYFFEDFLLQNVDNPVCKNCNSVPCVCPPSQNQISRPRFS